MARLVALQVRQSEAEGNRRKIEPAPSSPAARGDRHLNGLLHGIEPLLTSNEASQVLRIHPKVLERMAKRGEIPALKVGKFWRYRAGALDAWINSRLQPTPR